MTPEEHNKYVGIAHLVYGGVHLLFILLFMLFFLAMFMSATPSGPEGPPIGFMIAMWAFFSIFYGAFIIPSFIAGYGLLKRKTCKNGRHHRGSARRDVLPNRNRRLCLHILVSL